MVMEAKIIIDAKGSVNGGSDKENSLMIEFAKQTKSLKKISLLSMLGLSKGGLVSSMTKSALELLVYNQASKLLNGDRLRTIFKGAINALNWAGPALGGAIAGAVTAKMLWNPENTTIMQQFVSWAKEKMRGDSGVGVTIRAEEPSQTTSTPKKYDDSAILNEIDEYEALITKVGEMRDLRDEDRRKIMELLEIYDDQIMAENSLEEIKKKKIETLINEAAGYDVITTKVKKLVSEVNSLGQAYEKVLTFGTRIGKFDIATDRRASASAKMGAYKVSQNMAKIGIQTYIDKDQPNIVRVAGREDVLAKLKAKYGG